MSAGTAPGSPEQAKPPGKALKILTLDGGGLQAISTLLILDRLLDAIAQKNAEPYRKPKPCEIFDTIAGIGAGGWLALLLGRFRMDITSCLSEWYKITGCIAPKSKTEELRMRLIHHCYFDTRRLVEQVKHLTKLYGTGDYLYEREPDGARTRHVFVAALKSDASGYNIFRTYELPKSASLPDRFLEGPENPQQFKISSAFGVTGAAKYFTPEWKEEMSISGKIRFSDTKFPKPHNITNLALNEMWAMYGTEVPLSVVINLGPGLANEIDIKRIARRFSWGSKTSGSHTPISLENEKVTKAEDEMVNEPVPLLTPEMEGHIPRPSSAPMQSHEDMVNRIANLGPSAESEHKGRVLRTTTLGSVEEEDFNKTLSRSEVEIEENIMMKLNKFYPNSARLYYRIAPASAPEGTAQNDSSAPAIAFNATLKYLKQPRVGVLINEAVERIPKTSSRV